MNFEKILLRQILTKSKKFQNSKIFWGKFIFDIIRRFSPKKFWILKFFGLRQNLTRQLPAQIKKVFSKFWICYTICKYLSCGAKIFFKKVGAEGVLIFFLIFDATHFDAKNFDFQIFFFVKILLDTKPFDCLNTIFFRNCFLGLQSTKCQMV